MPTRVAKSSIKRARQLRRTMTDGEKRLWAELKDFRKHYGIHVRKQAPIGDYCADFAIQERRLIIEVDGEHHFTPEGQARDAKRDAWLESIGYRVLRFNTGELSDSFDGCIEEILHALGLMASVIAPPPLAPPLKGEGGVNLGALHLNSDKVSKYPSPSRGGGIEARNASRGEAP